VLKKFKEYFKNNRNALLQLLFKCSKIISADFDFSSTVAKIK